MATTTANIAASNSSDATFRAWITFIRDVFLNAGWVQTSDTGQINFATVLKPAGATTKQGYAIFRMADALQATHPVYVKWNFGSSGFSATNPGIWFSVGAGTDGAGNMINSLGLTEWIIDYERQTNPAMGVNTNDPLPRLCFGSGTTSSAVFALWEAQPAWVDSPLGSDTSWSKTTPDHIGAEANLTLMFSIERAKDWTGANTGDYLQVSWSAGAGGNGSTGGADQTATFKRNTYIATNMSEFTNLTAELNGLSYGLAQSAPSGATTSRGLLLNPLTTAPIPFLNHSVGMPPGINVLLSRSELQEHNLLGVYVSGTLLTATVYGVAHTYRVFAGMRAGSESAQDSNAHVYILFE